MREPEKINLTEKKEIAKQLTEFYKNYSITNNDTLTKLDELIKELHDFDKKKMKAQSVYDQEKASYPKIVKTLLDYAPGIDFDIEYGGLSILSSMNISGLNFIGLSIEGKPITREMLTKRNLEGSDKALVSINDLKTINDDSKRQEKLISILNNQCSKQGKLIDSQGTVNLIPLCSAAKTNNIEAAKTRLSAGVDPNNQNKEDQTPLVLAAEKGHFEMVKLLAEHKEINNKSIKDAINKIAKSKEHEKIAEYLFERLDVNVEDNEGNYPLHVAVKKAI